jgi:hydroxymethylpyrimidine/phosphomethylpyrimidine kinase
MTLANRSGLRPAALSVAGSDSGGGAGIQMDLRVFARLGVFGTTAITAVTAQDLLGVHDVALLEARQVRSQIEAVLGGFAVRAVKTGMLGSREVVLAVAETLRARGLLLVIDPVMVATSGARLLAQDAVEAYHEHLLPLAALVTPNLDEAAVLLGVERVAEGDLRAVAEALYERLGCPVLLKGGHLPGDPLDILRHAAGVVAWRHARIPGINTHGSGCLLSAAIASRLALGDELTEACAAALAFTHDALARGLLLASGARLADVEGARAESAELERVE